MEGVGIDRDGERGRESAIEGKRDGGEYIYIYI